MSIITRQEEIDNRWLTWVDIGDNNCMLFETDNKLSENEAQTMLDASLTPPEEPDGTTN